VGGTTQKQAITRLTEGLAVLGPRAARRGTRVLLEPLAPHLSDVVNTIDEALAIVAAAGSEGLGTMLDTHNTPAETLPIDELVRRHAAHFGHVHLNEMDGRRPGLGNYDFGRLLHALLATTYRGWLSVEAFDFKPDGVTMARDAARYLHRVAGVGGRA
jgi:sugar phosphate isomerase/epimerase